jgi:hypothetical protein
MSEDIWDKRSGMICKAYEGGASITDLCAKYRCDFRYMKARLLKWGVELRPSHGLEKTARNEQILELAKAGVPDSEIIKRVPDTNRNIVVGVRNRAGVLVDQQTRRRNQRAKMPLPSPFPPALQKLEALAKTAPRPSSADTEREMAKRWADQISPRVPSVATPEKPPRRILPSLPKSEMKLAPVAEGEAGVSRWVKFDRLTGCRWMEGEHTAEFAYCNAPTCRVKRVGYDDPIAVNYCAHHWDKRRSSANTRILA